MDISQRKVALLKREIELEKKEIELEKSEITLMEKEVKPELSLAQDETLKMSKIDRIEFLLDTYPDGGSVFEQRLKDLDIRTAVVLLQHKPIFTVINLLTGEKTCWGEDKLEMLEKYSEMRVALKQLLEYDNTPTFDKSLEIEFKESEAEFKSLTANLLDRLQLILKNMADAVFENLCQNFDLVIVLEPVEETEKNESKASFDLDYWRNENFEEFVDKLYDSGINKVLHRIKKEVTISDAIKTRHERYY